MEDAPQFDFHNIDGVMMLLGVFASQLIDKSLPVKRQAQMVAEFDAEFMNLRADHEAHHTATPDVKCPFCSALKLSAILNRTQS